MSSTTKTVLVVAGVAVGVYVVAKALTPARPTSTNYSLFGGSSSSALAGVTQGVVQGIGSFFSGGSGGSSSSSSASATGVPANFDTSNYSVSNGFEFTDSSGNFVAG